MVSEPAFTAIVAYAGTLTIILAGVIGWIVRRIWKMHSEDLPAIKNRLTSLEQTLLGNPDDENDIGHTGMTENELETLHQRIDDVEDLIAQSEKRRREEHREVADAISDIAYVLKDEGMNGRVPDPDDLDEN